MKTAITEQRTQRLTCEARCPTATLRGATNQLRRSRLPWELRIQTCTARFYAAACLPLLFMLLLHQRHHAEYIGMNTHKTVIASYKC